MTDDIKYLYEVCEIQPHDDNGEVVRFLVAYDNIEDAIELKNFLNRNDTSMCVYVVLKTDRKFYKKHRARNPWVHISKTDLEQCGVLCE